MKWDSADALEWEEICSEIRQQTLNQRGRQREQEEGRIQRRQVGRKKQEENIENVYIFTGNI